MILDRILAIFTIMAVGFAAKKLKAVDATLLKALSSFLLTIALPFTFLGSFDRSIPRSALPELGIMLLATIAVHAFAIGFSSIAYRRFPAPQRSVLSFATVFANSLFMGLPVVQSVAGTEGLMFGAVYNMVFSLLVYSYGIALFVPRGGWEGLRKALLNPGIIAFVLGFIIWLLPFSLPGFILEAIGFMSKVQTPVAMFIVGATIAGIDLSSFKSLPALMLAVAVRLFIMPGIIYLAIRLTGFSGTAPSILFLLVSMPAAAQTVVMASNLGGDSKFASEIVFVTTMLSIITIPFVAGITI